MHKLSKAIKLKPVNPTATIFNRQWLIYNLKLLLSSKNETITHGVAWRYEYNVMITGCLKIYYFKKKRKRKIPRYNVRTPRIDCQQDTSMDKWTLAVEALKGRNLINAGLCPAFMIIAIQAPCTKEIGIFNISGAHVRHALESNDKLKSI